MNHKCDHSDERSRAVSFLRCCLLCFEVLSKVNSIFKMILSLWMKSQSVPIQMKAVERVLPAVRCEIVLSAQVLYRLVFCLTIENF